MTPIIRTNDGRHFIARDAGPDLDHAYEAIRVKLVGGNAVPCADRRPRLIRRAGCVVINAADYDFAEFA